MLKNTIFKNVRYTTSIPTDPTTTDIKTNMRHIPTSIVSRHLATRGNNKILRTAPPHISSSKEIPPRLTRRILANSEQINHPSSKYTYTKSTPKHIHHHYAPPPLLHSHTQHTSSLKLYPHTHHIGTPGFVEDPAGVTALLVRWTEKLWTTSLNIRTPPPHKQGSRECRQQQQHNTSSGYELRPSAGPKI